MYSVVSLRQIFPGVKLLETAFKIIKKRKKIVVISLEKSLNSVTV